MRIREEFAAERTSEELQYRKKFFIASEGEATEPLYFDKINQTVIKENYKIINILRDYALQGHSHPNHLIVLLSSFLENIGEEVTVSELFGKISNWNHENHNRLDLNEIKNRLLDKYGRLDYRIQYDDLDDLFMELFKSDVYSELANHFEKYFAAQDVTYSPEVDSLNMVIDRDKDNFFEEQYNSVVEFCKDNNINLYVSNPNFELWLLMHFDEFDNENKDELLENKKITQKRRYIEKRLHDIAKYKKNYIPFEKFEPGIHKAILRSKKYARDTNELKDNLGSNVGDLVEELINEN